MQHDGNILDVEIQENAKGKRPSTIKIWLSEWQRFTGPSINPLALYKRQSTSSLEGILKTQCLQDIKIHLRAAFAVGWYSSDQGHYKKRYHSTLPSCTTTDQTAPHLEVIEAIATLGVIADEAHLKRRLRVLHHGRCHYNRGHRFLGLVVKLHPPNNTASS